MVDSPIAFFSREDYEAIKRLFPNHPDFPDSYDERLYLSNKHLLEEQSRGHAVEKVVVNSNEFTWFCDRTGRERDKAALTAFVIEEASRHRKLGTPPVICNESGRTDTLSQSTGKPYKIDT